MGWEEAPRRVRGYIRKGDTLSSRRAAGGKISRHGSWIARLVLMVAIAMIGTAMFAAPTLAHHKPGHAQGPTKPKDKGDHGKKPDKPKDKGGNNGKKPDKPKDGGVHDNRGTVKIHEGAAEPSPVMRTQPQVCTFHVHAFKFHADQLLTVSIVGHGGPNAGPSSYQGSATTDSTGEVRVPATGAITLADGMYKLTVGTGHGNGGKHKVLKIDCAEDAGNNPPPPDNTNPPPPDNGNGDNTPPPPANGNGNNPPPPPASGNGDNTPPPPASGNGENTPPNPGNGENTPPNPGTDDDTGTDAPAPPAKPGDLPDTAMDMVVADWSSIGVAATLLVLLVIGGFALATRRQRALR
jgi:hypothetical protein